ncbi:MAG: endonuclease III [Alphaproteobacteria bacterium]|nr:endonuclease III [Alphaproteobacteria bacterium]
MTLEAIHSIFDIFHQLNPNPQTELYFEDPYTLLIAVMLSAQTTDINVNKATDRLFKLAKTPETMITITIEDIEASIKNLNYYITKAKNILAISKILIAQYHGQVPPHRDALETLPGVGRKTANVVLNVAFNQPTLAVDTHIHRVANRMGLCTTKTPLDTERELLAHIPPPYIHNAHHWLILHGRYICKARNPECQKCPVNKVCHFFTC